MNVPPCRSWRCPLVLDAQTVTCFPRRTPMNTSTAASAAQPSKALHIALWLVQALLALAFIYAPVLKMTQPMEVLAPMMPWTAVVGPVMTRFIGTAELLGGLGMILPSATRIIRS